MPGFPRAPELSSLSLSSPLSGSETLPRRLRDHRGAVLGQLWVQASEEGLEEGNLGLRSCSGRGEQGNAKEGEELSSTRGCSLSHAPAHAPESQELSL